MSKYSGLIGYSVTSETSRGIWESTIVEKVYYGDVMSLRNVVFGRETISGNTEIRNQISIIADPYAINNFQNARYITWHGSKWSISSIEVQYPRLIIQIGGIYNENTSSSSSNT